MRQTLALLFFFVQVGVAATITREEVEAGSLHIYQERLRHAAERFDLDSDSTFQRRVVDIAGKLIAQLGADQTRSSGFKWEIHTVTDPEENASCMAGGKILVGQSYVNRLELTDAELAMLIAHEIFHAALEHNVKEMREALRVEPQWAERPYAELEWAIDHDASLIAKLETFDAHQELEADHEGFLLALHAGWPAAELATYFKKIVRADPAANVDRGDHPSPVQRWQAIRALMQETDSKTEHMH